MWNLKVIDTDKSLYLAIADAIERDIQLGILKAGDKLPTHRALAVIVGVNVTTITRAYQEAEKRGLVTSTVGRGTFITSDLGINPSLLNTSQRSAGCIDMGLVLPLCYLEPDIHPVINKVQSKSNLSSFMTYTPPQGLASHREIGSTWIKQYGVNTSAENIIITAGAQHALICIFSSLFQPGDHIAVDCLTYPGVKTAAKRCGIFLEGIPMDLEGMDPAGLAAACKRTELKGIYTVTSMQNPTNSSMSRQRRQDIAKIIEANHLLLIEDDLYAFLSPGRNHTLTSLLPEQSIYISSTSKAFYAGLRICFTAAPIRYCNRISQAIVDTMWMAPALNAEIVCECIESGLADRIMARKRTEIQVRAELLKEILSGYSFQYEENSMFAWLSLPHDWTTISFEQAAREHGVHVISSDKFTVGCMIPPDYVRLSLTGTERRDDFEKGLSVIAKLLDHELFLPSGII